MKQWLGTALDCSRWNVVFCFIDVCQLSTVAYNLQFLNWAFALILFLFKSDCFCNHAGLHLIFVVLKKCGCCAIRVLKQSVTLTWVYMSYGSVLGYIDCTDWRMDRADQRMVVNSTDMHVHITHIIYNYKPHFSCGRHIAALSMLFTCKLNGQF